MEKPNLIQEKSYSFALKIILTYKKLVLSKEPFAILNQLLRSGTSIGANVEEGIGGQTKKDFASKMSIAYKESRESHYWLRLFKDSEILAEKDVAVLLDDCTELEKILASIVKTSYGKNEKLKKRCD
jgi:four helix bundle protein